MIYKNPFNSHIFNPPLTSYRLPTIFILGDIHLTVFSKIKNQNNLRNIHGVSAILSAGMEIHSHPIIDRNRKNSTCFDCNICFEFASDPVITLCGHLYCWPCIYKWFDSKSSSVSLCPVCKAEISERTMVPLYGRGQSFSESNPTEKVIPPRPTASGIKGLTGSSDQEPQLAFVSHDPYRQNPRNFTNPDSNYEGESLSPLLNLYGTAAMALSHQMFGEMVNARGFGSSDSFYSNQSVGSSTPTRLRRLELQADRSLNRVSIFLFCCFILCLLLF